MSGTGENETGLRKILDFTRLSAVVILLLHVYFYCYHFFQNWDLRSTITDRLLINLQHTGLFDHPNNSKILALTLLVISLIGVKGKKEETLHLNYALIGILIGFTLFFASTIILSHPGPVNQRAIFYLTLTMCGFLLILSNGTKLSRLIKLKLTNDIFNELNETFPQEERLIQNEYSINLPAKYKLQNKVRTSYINIINPFRSTLVLGSPGSGKSYFVIQHVIKQHIEKGFAMLVYDFKYDDLSRIAYNWLNRFEHRYPKKPTFYVINFDNLAQSHRCNPLDPSRMLDITDATESARTILLGLNRDWINKQGDFFVESPINFITAIIWFLRTYENGKFCTLPHVIELMQASYDDLFPVLNSQPEIEVLINPFITAYTNNAMEQLEGQVASAKIGMARLASPPLYWILSGNDFSLDINDPEHPKIVCMGNNPEKQQIYGAVLSLFISRLVRQVNKKDKQKCSLVFDEFPTIFFNNIDSLIATARSNKVATTLAMQDFSQLKKDYGKDQAEVIMNITGNVISGQVTGESAKQLSERFGKIMQARESVSINRNDTSISRSRQLDQAVPAAKIASLSSGEFVGMVADDPLQKIKLKMFHAEIQNDHEALSKEADEFESIPTFQTITTEQIITNFHQIKMDIRILLEKEIEKLKNIKFAAHEN